MAMGEEDELSQIRSRKAAQLEQHLQMEESANQQQAMVDAQRAALLRQILTPEARERLGSLRTAYPQVAAAVEQQLILLYQSGRVRTIDDQTLKQILAAVAPKKREISITRR